MPLLKAEADKLSTEDLVRGIIEEIIEKDDLFAIMPWVQTNGKVYHYNRENALSEASFIGVNDVVPEGAATFTEVNATLKILAGDVDVDKFLSSVEGDSNDQVAVQIAQKAKGLNRKFKRTLAAGDSTADTNSFDGLARIAPVGQTIAAGANGGALTLGLLDQLLDLVPNGADVIVMPRSVITAYRALVRAAGGTDPVMIMMENFGRPMLQHNGVPIIMNEFIERNETQGTAVGVTTSVYALRLNEVDGFHGIYGGGSAGVRFEEIGTVQNKDAERFRMKWYVAVALKSTKSMARLKGLTNI